MGTLTPVRDVELEARIRAIPGVTTCTVGPESVVVVAARGIDAGRLENRVRAAAALEGRSIKVLGGVRMAAGAAGSRGRGGLPELGRVALVAGAAAALVGLVVGPSSAGIFESVLPPVAPASSEVVDAAGRPVTAVSHRTPRVERLTSSPSRAELVVEPAVRRRAAAPRPAALPQARAATSAASAGAFANLRAVVVAEPQVTLEPVVSAAPATPETTSGGKAAKERRRKGDSTFSAASTSTATQVTFSTSSTSSTADAKGKSRRPAKQAEKHEEKADKDTPAKGRGSQM